MILENFLKETFTLRVGERRFRETVSQPIVLSIDVGEIQALKVANEIFCLPTLVPKVRWGEHSRSNRPIDDYCGITKYMDEWDPHHMGNEEKSP